MQDPEGLRSKLTCSLGQDRAEEENLPARFRPKCLSAAGETFDARARPASETIQPADSDAGSTRTPGPCVEATARRFK